MSLRNKFLSDPKSNAEGIWFDYNDAPNKDGTIPGVLLARQSVANPAYSKAISDISMQIEESGVVLTDEQDVAQSTAIMADTIVKGWRNIQPEDDGKSLEYNRENVIALLSKPEWVDLRIDWRTKAANAANYRKKLLDNAAKN